MTNKEAIEILEQMRSQIANDRKWLALDVAIEALKREEELTEYMRGYLAGCNDTSNKLKELSNLSIRISKEDMI